MTAGLLLAFAGFAFVSSITPGPNNVMLLASGVNFGFRRTIPHMFGISLGVALMLVLVGIGLAQLFVLVPALYSAMRIAAVAYLLWLAWRIARAGPVSSGGVGGRPLRLWQAAAFQWVNPKAWIMVVGGATTYAPRTGFLVNVMLLAAVLASVNLPSVGVWALFGSRLRGVLAQPGRLRAFNVAMALLLVLSLVPMIRD